MAKRKLPAFEDQDAVLARLDGYARPIWDWSFRPFDAEPAPVKIDIDALESAIEQARRNDPAEAIRLLEAMAEEQKRQAAKPLGGRPKMTDAARWHKNPIHRCASMVRAVEFMLRQWYRDQSNDQIFDLATFAVERLWEDAVRDMARDEARQEGYDVDTASEPWNVTAEKLCGYFDRSGNDKRRLFKD